MTWTAYIQHTGFVSKYNNSSPNDFTWQDVDHPLQVLGFQAPSTELLKTKNWRGNMTLLKCYPRALSEDDVGKI